MPTETAVTMTEHQEELANSISTLRRLIELRDATADQLNALEDHIGDLRQNVLPTLFAEMGITSTKLEDGTKLDLKQEIYTSIPKERQEEAYAWMCEHGYGALIKADVTASFDRDQIEKAKEAVGILSEKGYSPTLKQGVHAATLKANVKNWLEEGVAIPFELFSVVTQQVVAVKEGKKELK